MSNHKLLRPDAKVTHVIFDVDGLLLDTERIYTECFQEICAEFDKEFTWDIKVKQMGKKEKESGQVLLDTLNLPLSLDELIRKLREKLDEKLPFTELLPGAEKLIRHLHNHHIPIALASGSDGWCYRRKIASHKELFSLFHHCVLSSDDPEVTHGKPSPDCFLVCARRFDDSPKLDQVLVFEDAPNGVEAALAAGMRVVWVPDDRADRSSFEGRVDLILDSLENFKPECFGLPAFNSS
ncbi:unnamed protein product [Candidula unifasciata]|uniref:pseudouridine 5'-phosphatase n=1 Tax=Candidula unifasciata TaxID=100452 RepID=A0A8S4A141_9EUPU|nr:unnamed protein product [Candidula unifasciata]